MNAADGSKIAKGGYQNEDDIINKFNDWQSDVHAQQWIGEMGYDVNAIKSLSAISGADAKREIQKIRNVKLGPTKTDVQLCVMLEVGNETHIENIQAKLVSVEGRGPGNQVDKRWVSTYAEMWNIPDPISNILKRFTGEISPNVFNTKYDNRMIMHEFTQAERNLVLQFVNRNKIMIVNDVLKGRGPLATEWFLVVRSFGDQYLTTIKPINVVTNFFGGGDVVVSPKGSINIGRIRMQRKGGDSGRTSAQTLQFKVYPTDLL